MTDRTPLISKLESLASLMEGTLHWDHLHQILYATDASAYREIPLGVAYPKSTSDIRQLIEFATTHKIPLVPRTAGTSLAGQVVGDGLIVDTSRYLTRILEINPEEHWVRVEPGVILDELNKVVAAYGLFFGPETSTSSRCMIGGMVGNNSCGAHSILYGSTRDHLISVKAVLADGEEVLFKALEPGTLEEKCRLQTREGAIYRTIDTLLSDPRNQQTIREEYPDPALHRRNTGYALDLMLDAEPYGGEGALNLAKLLAGSEGTLAFLTEIKLNLVPLPPKEKALVCMHCNSIEEALKANLIALKFQPGSVELMDKALMDCTRDNITQRKNRFFIEGDPGAMLLIEFARESREEILKIATDLEKAMRQEGFGYAFPVVFPPKMKQVWDLRKAGLGVLSNYPGDRKPVAVTEDTAVMPERLPDYIHDFMQMLEELGLNCVYHAHVGSGELHLRPILNLKLEEDVRLFHEVALRSAQLVKEYRGSLSGEHGDGRLRGEFIPLMLGEVNYNLLKEVKRSWDPHGIFNPGKIVDTPKMNTSLRFQPGQAIREIDTVFDFSHSEGILRAAEQCNGSGDCRNTVVTGRWMCPSYMATLDERNTTRARANVLRELLTTSSRSNPFDHHEIHEVMDLCLSCKACKSECPSNVDITRLKAEFLQHYHDAHGIPLRTRMIAYLPHLNRLGSLFPGLYNGIQKNRWTSGLIKQVLGFASGRSIPLLSRTSLRKWLRRHLETLNNSLKEPKGSLYLYVDEFTNHQDAETGICFVKLLNGLGYRILVAKSTLSGRTFLSKGLIRTAQKIARRNVEIFAPLIGEETPLVGIEPSAILGFRDEFPDLVGPAQKAEAMKISKHALLYDEFIMREVHKGLITPEAFTREPAIIRVHGHCHQKALASVQPTVEMLSLPMNYSATEIPSGCCGMAGSFGYEKEHYHLSMQVGELVLFPEVRKADPETHIAAPGTSCRHQIKEGTGREARHPVEILWEALLKS